MPVQPMKIYQNLKAMLLDILKNEWLKMKTNRYACENVILTDSLQIKMWVIPKDISPTK